MTPDYTIQHTERLNLSVRVFGEEYIPEWALYYLINGEDDTLTEEDIETIKQGLETHGIKEVFPPEPEAESSFTWSPMFGKACNEVLCPVEYI